MSFAYLAVCSCGKRSSFTSAKKISRIQCSACKALIPVELRHDAAKQVTTPQTAEKTLSTAPVVQPTTMAKKKRNFMPAIIAAGLMLAGPSVAAWWLVSANKPNVALEIKADDEDDMMVVRTSLNPSEAVNKSLLTSCVWILGSKPGGISCGSGVLVDQKNRLLVTNEHVVSDLDRIVAVFPQWKNGELLTNPYDYVDKKNNAKSGFTAKVVKTSVESDLAILQVDQIPETALACPISKEPAKAGAKIYTIGNANSLDAKSSVLFTFASGDVRQRSNGPMTWKSGRKEHHAVTLTTTLPINPGDSGGPVVSIQQQQLGLVGVNQSKDLSRTNMTYIVDRDEIQTLLKNYYQSANITPATVPPIIVQDELVVTKVDVGKLLERLDSDEVSLQRRALSRLKKHADNSVAEVLEKLPKTLARLVELNTQSETPKDMQRMCLSLLTKIDKPGAEDTRPLQLALLSKNPELREQALRLIEASDVKLIGSLGKPIMQLLDPEKEKNTLNRQRCLRLLIKLKENAPAESLEACLNICFDDDDSEMRLLAATGAKELMTVLSRDQVSLMKKALKNDRRSGVRQPLLSICSRQQPWCAKELIDELIAILQQDSDPTTLAEVAKTLKLAEIKFPYDDKANNALAELWRWLPKLTGPEQQTFINVLQSVMCFEPTSLHGHLNDIIKNPGSIRPLASPSLHALINASLLHSSPDVRNTALLAVLNTGESIRPVCENAVRSIAEYDTKLELRKKAVITLHAMRAKNQETLATLLKVQQMKQTSEESEQELALMSAKILEAMQFEPMQAVTLSTGYLPSIMQTLRWAAYSGPEYEPAMVWMIQAISAHQQSAELMCPYLLAFLFQDKYTKAADAAEIALIKLEERVVPALCASYLLIRIEEGNRGLLAQHLIQRHISNEAVAMKRFYDQSNSHEDFLQLIDNIERRFDIKQQMIRVLKTSLPEERRLINIMHKLSKPVQSRVLSLMRQQSVYVQTRRYSDVMALACCQLLSHLEADVVETLEKHASDFGATAVSGMTRLDFISAIGMNMYRQKDSAKKLAAMKALERLQTLYEQKVDEHMKRSSQGVGDFAELRDCVKTARLMMDNEPTLVLKGRRYGSKPIGNSRPK